ncbi:Protein kinase C-like phorbol ester/diacylglycerol-binding domain [Arabidopsis suecica]|uniref:Protein kinase C-like phorbol ester/diacylglycerol-binding domain n=1 Tax=Arabidopsis suecica TaxID=45249 RepID=A0A8T2EID5_ARASU|nr:Protein kinase C-like phorbol ester/diacylglycerol-binding domain [Arabidopsis suecica]
MDSDGVSVPLIHEHLMMPCNDLRRGDCCERLEAISDGYYCTTCDFFVHKKCGDEASECIENPFHSNHPLRLGFLSRLQRQHWLKVVRSCDLCGKNIGDLFYRCEICDFDMDLHCAKYPPLEVIDIPEMHSHKLNLLKDRVEFDCDAKCGKIGYGFPYECHECDSKFHVDCVRYSSSEEVKHPLEVNHSYHSLHPLKLFMGQPPDYSDGKCRLCGRKIDDKLFYHCSSCNFTLDMRCVLNPPPKSVLDLKTHDHQLNLLPRLISFTCNACGLNGDRSPYACFQCDFLIHKDCFGLPRLININRHDHRMSRTSLIGIVNSVCGVCRQKVDWTCGGYSCQRCSTYIAHSKCATREDVWNGKELEGVPEEIEDIEPYVVIDDNTIQHFSHKEHYMRLNVNGLMCEVNKRCNACNHPISPQSFYGCMDCDFILHQNCAGFPRRKWHVLHNERLALVTSEVNIFGCSACHKIFNGFRYEHEDTKLDVLCGSFSEPFIHPSHPHHPLYCISPEDDEVCSGCNERSYHVLRCIEDNCGFILDFGCATFPQVVKHRIEDQPLSLCYGEKASGKYWCDICEKETNPNTWFYTCKDHRASLHTWCVLGDFMGLIPKSTIELWNISYEVVLNNSISRPICRHCKSHCIPPIILKKIGTSDPYFCSLDCIESFKRLWRAK